MRFDRFSYFFDFALCPLLIVGFIIGIFQDPSAMAKWAALGFAALGLVLWTLIEYVVHRWFFHHAPYFRDMHAVHHASPRVLVSSLPGLLPATVIGFSFAMFIGFGLVAFEGASIGLVSGYLFYSFVHYATHHIPAGRWRYLQLAKQRHLQHHFGAADSHFGVTTIFWDRVFSTDRVQRRSGGLGVSPL